MLGGKGGDAGGTGAMQTALVARYHLASCLRCYVEAAQPWQVREVHCATACSSDSHPELCTWQLPLLPAPASLLPWAPLVPEAWCFARPGACGPCHVLHVVTRCVLHSLAPCSRRCCSRCSGARRRRAWIQGRRLHRWGSGAGPAVEATQAVTPWLPAMLVGSQWVCLPLNTQTPGEMFAAACLLGDLFPPEWPAVGRKVTQVGPGGQGRAGCVVAPLLAGCGSHMCGAVLLGQLGTVQRRLTFLPQPLCVHLPCRRLHLTAGTVPHWPPRSSRVARPSAA